MADTTDSAATETFFVMNTNCYLEQSDLQRHGREFRLVVSFQEKTRFIPEYAWAYLNKTRERNLYLLHHLRFPVR
jgi:hypothetical protein